MAEYKNGECKYFPHVALKNRNIMDVLRKADEDYTLYFMDCAQGMDVNLLVDSDPIANDLGKFKMSHTCEDLSTYQFGIAEDAADPSMFKSHIAGFQSLTMSICQAPFKVFRWKTLSIEDIESLGYTQEYLSKIKPGAVATSHGWFKVSHRDHCGYPNGGQSLIMCPRYGHVLTGTKLGLQLLVNGAVQKDEDLYVERVSSNNACSRNQQCDYTNDFVNVLGIGTFPTGPVALNTSGESESNVPGGIVLGGTELLIDPPFYVGCFTFEDNSLDSLTPTTTATAKECLVVCNDKSLRFAAVSEGTNCYCFENLPQESVIPSKVQPLVF